MRLLNTQFVFFFITQWRCSVVIGTKSSNTARRLRSRTDSKAKEEMDWASSDSKPPLGLCQGGCNNDSDCQDSLICFRLGQTSDTIPGCPGSDIHNIMSGYCVVPSADNIDVSPRPLVKSNGRKPPQPLKIGHFRQLDKSLLLDYDNEQGAPIFESSSFSSYFEVEYETLDGTTEGLEEAANVLATTYNDLIAQFDDPFSRRMEQVRVVSTTVQDFSIEQRREQEIDEVTTLFVLAILEAVGGCLGCPADLNFSNQIIPGRNLQEEEILEEPCAPTTSADVRVLPPGAPSEDEIFDAYSEALQAGSFGNIVNAASLDELESFTSFFEVKYETLDGTTEGLEEAANALVVAYNQLITQFDDPFSRRMGDVRVLSARGEGGSDGRRQIEELDGLENVDGLDDPNELDLDGIGPFFILAILEAVGGCNGCPNDSTYSNQIIPGRSLPEDDNVEEPDASFTSGDVDFRVVPLDLPSEGEIMDVYSDALQSGDFGSIGDVATLDEIDSFSSFFEVKYETLDGTTEGLEAAADALGTAYNNLITQFNDPFTRRMGAVRVLSTTNVEFGNDKRQLEELDGTDNVDGLDDPDGLDLDGIGPFFIFAILEAVGGCNGCPNDSTYSNQIIPGRSLQVEDSLEEPNGSFTSGDAEFRVVFPGLPSEGEIMDAYSDALQSGSFGNIEDVETLNELDLPAYRSEKPIGRLGPSEQPSYAPSVSPSSSPSASPSERPSKSPSATPSVTPTRSTLFTFPENPPPLSALPLQICEGDCDSDDDCDEGLYCHLRNATDAVPGCIGGELDLSRTDFCAPITLAPSGTPSESPSKIPSEAPSESPSKSPSEQPSKSPSTTPSNAPTRSTLFTFEDNPPPSSAIPLQICEGDCDSDEDCGEGLYCHFRNATDPVPGCIGGEQDFSRTDFCAPNNMATTLTPRIDDSTVSFRLGLFWHHNLIGRTNLEEEKDLCLQCRNECFIGNEFDYVPCSEASTRFEFVEVADTHKEISIRLEGTDYCWQQTENGTINIRKCDSSAHLQKWFPGNDEGSKFSDEFFEIRQEGFENKCLGTADAPKYLDTPSLVDCTLLQAHHITSYWKKIW